MKNKVTEAIGENTSTKIEKDADFVDFTAELKMDEHDQKGSTNPNTGRVYSYGEKTIIKQQLEDKFCICKYSGHFDHLIDSEITGNKKEILEIADYINRARDIFRKQLEGDPTCRRAEFKLNENGIPIIIFFHNEAKEGYEEEESPRDSTTEPHTQDKKIFEDRIWNSLPENNPIKRNITNILSFLYDTTGYGFGEH